jgi:hypothetical protein
LERGTVSSLINPNFRRIKNENAKRGYVKMPHTVYCVSSLGTVLTGITYKLRQGVELKWHEWLILMISLAVWGAVAFGIVCFTFPDQHHGVPSALVSVPLGLGLSEFSAFFIAAGQRMFEMLPESVRDFCKCKWGRK